MAKKEERHPASRIDHHNTHGWYARVYRSGDWEGRRLFSDNTYGGKDEAQQAALRWAAYIDATLMEIPPKPVLKVATLTPYEGAKGFGQRYYQLYLPHVGDDEWDIEKLYFNKDLDLQKKHYAEGSKRVQQRNEELMDAHRKALVEWFVLSAKMQEQFEVLKGWDG